MANFKTKTEKQFAVLNRMDSISKAVQRLIKATLKFLNSEAETKRAN